MGEVVGHKIPLLLNFQSLYHETDMGSSIGIYRGPKPVWFSYFDGKKAGSMLVYEA